MIICRWPDTGKTTRWNIDPVESMRANPEKPDSCVVLYWPYRPLSPGEVRKLAFTYGLNSLSSAEGGGDGRLALTTGGSTRPGREFTVTAYVTDPEAGQAVRLILPRGFSLVGGQEAERPVEGGGKMGTASWRVRSPEKGGDFVLEAASGAARTTLKLRIRDTGLY
jgi:hypothetical protein